MSDERLAEILGSNMAVGTSEQVGALIWKLACEVSEHRAREAASVWEYGLADPGATEPYSDYSTDRDWILDGVHPLDEGSVLLRRRAPGPWEPVTVGDDDD